MLKQEIDSYVYKYYLSMCTQQRRQQTKWRHLMMNVAVDWYNNQHTVDNGGHGSGLEYQHGLYWEAWKLKSSEYIADLYQFRNSFNTTGHCCNVSLPSWPEHNFNLQIPFWLIIRYTIVKHISPW